MLSPTEKPSIDFLILLQAPAACQDGWPQVQFPASANRDFSNCRAQAIPQTIMPRAGEPMGLQQASDGLRALAFREREGVEACDW